MRCLYLAVKIYTGLVVLRLIMGDFHSYVQTSTLAVDPKAKELLIRFLIFIFRIILLSVLLETGTLLYRILRKYSVWHDLRRSVEGALNR